MWMCVCLHFTSIELHGDEKKKMHCAFILNLQVKTIFSSVTWHRWAHSCDWLAGVIAVTSSLGIWSLWFI
jgi:hypothetical protein